MSPHRSVTPLRPPSRTAATQRLAVLTFCLAVLPPLHTAALDLASHCRQDHPADECPCSARPEAGRSFCLVAASPTLCVQQACATRFVCDCDGDTVCRRVAVRATLTCRTALTADAQCMCDRVALRAASAGSQPPSVLVPLRPHAPLVRAPSLCSEPPAFWAAHAGHQLLTRHWAIVRGDGEGEGDGGAAAALSVGHAGQSASFRSATALSRAVLAAQQQSDGFVEECAAAVVSTRLTAAGVATQFGRDNPDQMATTRLVFKPCAYLSREHPVVGMSVARFFERAGLLDGALQADDGALSRRDVVQACRAINRNFERCEVDVGCLSVAVL